LALIHQFTIMFIMRNSSVGALERCPHPAGYKCPLWGDRVGAMKGLIALRDATSRLQLIRFVRSESTFEYLQATKYP
jgi:hypothetical protein